MGREHPLAGHEPKLVCAGFWIQVTGCKDCFQILYLNSLLPDETWTLFTQLRFG